MPIDKAQYVATIRGLWARRGGAAFENQVAYCRDNGAPVTALVCDALRQLLDAERGGAVMRRVRRWAGPALADALPLRVAGGLHALHLAGRNPHWLRSMKGLARPMAPN